MICSVDSSSYSHVLLRASVWCDQWSYHWSYHWSSLWALEWWWFRPRCHSNVFAWWHREIWSWSNWFQNHTLIDIINNLIRLNWHDGKIWVIAWLLIHFSVRLALYILGFYSLFPTSMLAYIVWDQIFLSSAWAPWFSNFYPVWLSWTANGYKAFKLNKHIYLNTEGFYQTILCSLLL